jgi:hypothetical protein
MTTGYRYRLLDSSFAMRWRRDMVRFRQRMPRKGYPCNACEMRMACTACPAFFGLETGAEDVRSEYICAKAALRYEILKSKGRLPKTGSPVP